MSWVMLGLKVDTDSEDGIYVNTSTLDPPTLNGTEGTHYMLFDNIELGKANPSQISNNVQSSGTILETLGGRKYLISTADVDYELYEILQIRGEIINATQLDYLKNFAKPSNILANGLYLIDEWGNVFQGFIIPSTINYVHLNTQEELYTYSFSFGGNKICQLNID